MPPRLRIFISSPGDVPNERLRADLVVDKLAQDYSRFFTIAGYRWEHEPMLASGHFQDAVEPPSKFDIVVLILWSRLGTPLPPHTPARDYVGIDGRAPVTGTEWEYEDALRAARERGAPDILAFRNVSPAAIDASDREARARSIAQLDALDAFWKRHFADRGMFLAAYDEYRSIEEFARRLEESLRKLIERRIETRAGEGAALIWTGAPFRGLEAYEFEHAAIFFGRDALVAKAAEQVTAQARAGTAFLLVSGPSGSGKSSLLKAALVPRLMKPQRITGAAFVRRVVFRPAGAGSDLIERFATALTLGGPPPLPPPQAGEGLRVGVGLPELLGPGQDAAQLAAHLRVSADAPGFIFAGALGRLTEAGRNEGRLFAYEEAKLILVVDQLEELFTLPGISVDDRRLFVRLLAGLARCGAVWVVATIRADFWHHAADIPEMMALAQGFGRLDIAAPSPAELAEMIRKPAQAAGLSFEISGKTGIGLDATLAEHAAAQPGVLPLLSFTLDEIYRRDVAPRGANTLTYAAYETLGQLEGAIATRADEVVASLPPAAQAALPRVLRMLATVAAGTEDVAVARAVPIERFPPGSDARALVDALTAARLLVASSEGGKATVRLAHEALISRWARAREQLARDRRDIETRELVERQQRRWETIDASSKRQMLLRDPDLANAVDLARRWGDELDAKLLSFIRASQQRARLQQRLTVAAAVIFGLLAIAAAVAAQQAIQQQRIANEQRVVAETATREVSAQRDRATVEEARAKEARDRALNIQSRLLAERASRLSDQGDTLTAILLSLEAFRPADDQGPERYEAVAEKSLADALYRNALLGIIRDEKTDYVDAAFTFDGSMLVAARADGMLEFRSLDSEGRPGEKVDMPADFGSVAKVIANPKRPILVLRRSDKTYFAWNFQTRQAVPGIEGTCDDKSTPSQFRFDPAGERLLVYCTGVRIFDLSTGRVTDKPGPYASFALAGDGSRFAAIRESSRIIEVWSSRTGALVKSWKPGAAQGLAMSSDGEVVMTTTYSGVQFWKSATGAAVKPELSASQARTFDVEASPVGDLFLTEADDGHKVWSQSRDGAILQLDTGTPHFLPNGMLAVRDGKSIAIWEFVTEGHMGTSEGVRRAVLFADDNHDIVAKTADGGRLITLTDAGDLYVWQTGQPMLLQERSGMKLYLGTAVLSDDGKTIAGTSNTENHLVFWNADTLAETRRLNLSGYSEISWMRLSRDGQRVAFGASPTNPDKNATEKTANEYQVVDVASGKRLFPPAGGKQSSQIDLSADGEYVVSIEDEGVASWRLPDGSRIKHCAVGPDAIYTATFGANSDQVFAADEKNVIWRVDLRTCAATEILSFTDSDIAQLDLVYRDGILAARVTWREMNEALPAARMKIWSEQSKRQLFEYTSTNWNPFALVVANARPLLSEGGFDKFIHLYDLTQQQEVLTFRYYANSDWLIPGIGLAPDGTRLFTAWDQRGVSGLRIWRMFPTIDELRDFARRTIPECLSPERRKELGLDDAPPRWCIELAKPPYDTPEWRKWLADKPATRD